MDSAKVTQRPGIVHHMISRYQIMRAVFPFRRGPSCESKKKGSIKLKNNYVCAPRGALRGRRGSSITEAPHSRSSRGASTISTDFAEKEVLLVVFVISHNLLLFSRLEFYTEGSCVMKKKITAKGNICIML